MSAEPILEARRVVKRFGGLVAVNAVDLVLWPGEVLGLIGPNGAARRRCSTACPG